METQQPTKKAQTLMIVESIIIVLLIIALAGAYYRSTVDKKAETTLAMANYTMGFNDGIQYRNALIVKDLSEKGYTIMYDANDMSKSVTLIPAINPATNNP